MEECGDYINFYASPFLSITLDGEWIKSAEIKRSWIEEMYHQDGWIIIKMNNKYYNTEYKLKYSVFQDRFILYDDCICYNRIAELEEKIDKLTKIISERHQS